MSDKIWDWTIPGLIYPRISEHFPLKQQEQMFQVTLSPQFQPAQPLSTGLSKMQFLKNDRSAMVQIGPDLLAVNVLSPYPGWPSFFKLISEQFQIYGEMASPKGFRRIGLRYINAIEIKAERIEITDYFQYYPYLPKSVEQAHGPFSMRVVHSYADSRDVLVVTFTNTPSPTGQLLFNLDLDYSLAQPDKVKLDDGAAWVEDAHARVEEMFEACITDRLRQVFEEQQ